METMPSKKSFKNYLYFWSGQLFSLFGSMVVYFVIIWWVTEETQSPVYLALGSFFFIICQVIFMPIAGVLADRLNRKVIIVVADSLQAVTTLILLVLFSMNLANVWTVLIFISIRSIFQAFHLPAVNSIIPVMVPKENLSRINGINFLFTGVVQIIAPLIGATLMILVPINTILWVDVITFFIALIPLLLIKIPSVENHGEKVEKKSFLREFKQGLQTIKVIPGLVTIIFLSMLLNFLIRPFDTLMPYYINVFHGGSATHLAIVLVFFQGGMRWYDFWCFDNFNQKNMEKQDESNIWLYFYSHDRVWDYGFSSSRRILNNRYRWRCDGFNFTNYKCFISNIYTNSCTSRKNGENYFHRLFTIHVDLSNWNFTIRTLSGNIRNW